MPFQWDAKQPPFSFAMDGRSSREAFETWESGESAAEDDTRKQLRYRDPESGLCVCVHLRSFDDFPAWEWMLEKFKDVYFKAHGI